jgi:hypothetical protein
MAEQGTDDFEWLLVLAFPNGGSTALAKLLLSAEGTIALNPRVEERWLMPAMCAEGARWDPDTKLDYREDSGLLAGCRKTGRDDPGTLFWPGSRRSRLFQGAGSDLAEAGGVSGFSSCGWGSLVELRGSGKSPVGCCQPACRHATQAANHDSRHRNSGEGLSAAEHPQHECGPACGTDRETKAAIAWALAANPRLVTRPGYEVTPRLAGCKAAG